MGVKSRMKYPVAITVNGRERRGEVEARTLLVQFIREELRLTATRVGCETSTCGACTVILDGSPVKSCTRLAVQADGSTVLTLEGLTPGTDAPLHPLQAAFCEHHALQCGFCSAGMVLVLKDLLERSPAAAEREVRAALDGNICRCTGYQGIVKAALSVSTVTSGPAGGPGEGRA
jgi:carbon-monoxide dehydrogenase small subunit